MCVWVVGVWVGGCVCVYVSCLGPKPITSPYVWAHHKDLLISGCKINHYSLWCSICHCSLIIGIALLDNLTTAFALQILRNLSIVRHACKHTSANKLQFVCFLACSLYFQCSLKSSPILITCHIKTPTSTSILGSLAIKPSSDQRSGTRMQRSTVESPLIRLWNGAVHTVVCAAVWGGCSGDNESRLQCDATTHQNKTQLQGLWSPWRETNEG